MYGSKQLAESFRTVRKNTIQIAEDIPADKYDFQAAPGVKTVAQILAHVAVSPGWQIEAHTQRIPAVDFAYFGARAGKVAAAEQALATKAQIIQALERGGDEFASMVDGLTPEILAETVSFAPPMQPSQKTRFEMLLGVKEHEMHHRGQLMLIQRLIGIVPHLTRRREAGASLITNR
jgi:uncharacterized damage-inducible protein DinB